MTTTQWRIVRTTRGIGFNAGKPLYAVRTTDPHKLDEYLCADGTIQWSCADGWFRSLSEVAAALLLYAESTEE